MRHFSPWVSPRVLVSALLLSYSTLTSAQTDTTLQIPADQFVALAFHDVREDVHPEIDRDPFAMSTDRLAHLFDWIQQSHLQPVSLQQVLDAQQGKAKLPKNAVLLSFDDGPESNFTTVYPLLKAYHYPAILALETGWITGQVNNDAFGKEGFVTWAQLREMKTSGLIEFANHSHDLHRGILANPQGNLEPAATTRLYDPITKHYERDEAYRARIKHDLSTSSALIEQQLGVRPRAMVWPYGAMSQETRAIAASVGMPISFALGDDKINQIQDLKTPLSRILIANSPTPVQIERQIDDVVAHKLPVQRAVKIDLDDVYDPNPATEERNLGKLLDRVKALNVSTIYLKAFYTPEGDGAATQLYFPNRRLPIRADLFNRVAWQLRTRAGVQVYAALPLLGYRLPDQAQQQQLGVSFAVDGKPTPAQDSRLSPFLPESIKVVGDVYEDLAKNMPSLNGVFISGDAYLNEREDLQSCQPTARWPKTDQPIADCTHLLARDKTTALNNFADLVVARVQRYRDSSSNFRVIREIDARVVLNPALESQYAHDFAAFVAHYDGVAVWAVPQEQAQGQKQRRAVPLRPWLASVAAAAKKTPHGLDKVIFTLATRDVQSQQWLDSRVLRDQMQSLTELGVRNLAYSPDDFIHNQPRFDSVFGGISLNQFPAFYKNPQVGTAITVVGKKKENSP